MIDELLLNYSNQIKQLSDEISELRKSKKAMLQMLMDIDSQIVQAISMLESIENEK